MLSYGIQYSTIFCNIIILHMQYYSNVKMSAIIILHSYSYVLQHRDNIKILFNLSDDVYNFAILVDCHKALGKVCSNKHMVLCKYVLLCYLHRHIYSNQMLHILSTHMPM